MRGRAGYAFDRYLLYATAGAAFGDVKAGYSNHPASDTTEPGWTVGAGVEGSFAPHWSAKVEYLFVDLNNGSCTTDCAIANANGSPVDPERRGQVQREHGPRRRQLSIWLVNGRSPAVLDGHAVI